MTMPDPQQMKLRQSDMAKEQAVFKKTAEVQQDQYRGMNALRDKALEQMSRESLMQTRDNLKLQMYDVNKTQAQVEEQMQQSHIELRQRMRDSLEKVKAETRQRELLEARESGGAGEL